MSTTIIDKHSRPRPNSLLLCGSNFQENATKSTWGMIRFLCSTIRHTRLTLLESYRCLRSTISCATITQQISSSRQLIARGSDTVAQDVQPHIIIVGAGPSGLLGAVHLKTAFPKLHILILEREYPRTHEVVLNSENILDLLLQKRVQALGVSHGVARRVPIDILRQCLQERAAELNVPVQHAHVTDSSWICKQFPTTHCILIAEGAHSKLRKELFADDSKKCCSISGDMIDSSLDEYSFQNIVQIQYTVPTRVNKLDIINLHHAERLSAYVFEESVSYLVVNGGSKVTARFFVPDSVYISLPAGNQMNPLVLSEMPHDLQRAISVWLNIRSDPITQNIRATKFELKAFTCHNYSQFKHNRTWLLLGDAAFAIPYFRALNAGAYCASRLPQWLCAFFSRLQYDHATRLSIREETTWRHRLFFKFARELISASAKDAIVEMLKSVVLLSGSVPESMQLTPLPPWALTLHPVFTSLSAKPQDEHQQDSSVHTLHPAKQFVRTAQRTALRLRVILVIALIVLAFAIMFIR